MATLMAKTVLMPPEYACLKGLPSALSFREPLNLNVKSSEIVLYSGCHSGMARRTGFRLLTSNALKELAAHHGYTVKFLDELEYKKLEGFVPQWLRVFALPALRIACPFAKYFVWLDDDILTPYPETDMLNHYINLMENDPDAMMMFVREPPPVKLNSGFIIMKNSQFVVEAYMEAIRIAREPQTQWTTRFGYEQDAIIEYIHRHPEHYAKFMLRPNREGPYNINTFVPNVGTDFPGAQFRAGDAFVHVLGGTNESRLRDMLDIIDRIKFWRRGRPTYCNYPVDVEFEKYADVSGETDADELIIVY